MPPTMEADIVFNGKLFTSLKRLVDLPFKGIITCATALLYCSIVVGTHTLTVKLSIVANS